MQRINTPFIFSNGLKLRNPVVMAPMTTWAGDDDGQLTSLELDYYRARSNGVGMVITGTTFMSQNGKGFAGQYFAGSDGCLPQLTALADAIKEGGARAVLQIFHAGRNSTPELTRGLDVVSALNIPAEREGAVVPRSLEIDEIEELIQSFAQVTARAIKAGFDGVEIHGANTYLLQQFFSPHANRRNDDWGGTREKRSRFPLAVVKAVLDMARKLAKPEFIVGYRLSPEEVEQPGITLDDTEYLVEQLANTNLSYLHLSMRQHFSTSSLRDSEDRRVIGSLVAQVLRGRLPLIGVGQIQTKDDVEAALSLGYDLVAVGKSLLYDPQWMEKILSGSQPISALSVDRMHEACVPERMFNALFERRQAMNVRFEPAI